MQGSRYYEGRSLMMASESLLSIDREKYWRNRLSKKCANCGLDIRSEQEFYRNTHCGHEECVICFSQYIGKNIKLECTICQDESVLYEKCVPATFEDELKKYTNEVMEAATKPTAGVFCEKDFVALQERNAELVRKAEELEMKLKVNSEQTREANAELKNLHCMECGYAVIFEKSRICVSCGIVTGVIKRGAEEGDLGIVSFDKAEISLLCGSCVLDGAHENHHVVNYFKLKTAQLSAAHNSEMNRRLNATFDDGWDTVCQKMRECHEPVIEILTKPDVNSDNMDSWEKFKKKQLKEKNIIHRMIENKSNMVGYIHKYTGDMKALLTEARTILQGAKEKIDACEQAVLEVEEESDPAKLAVFEQEE